MTSFWVFQIVSEVSIFTIFLNYKLLPFTLLNAIKQKERGGSMECDKVIIVDGHHFSINSTILATQSSFFEKLFSCGFRESEETYISLHLPQLTKRGFNDWLIELEHPECVVMGRENVLEILKVANFTQSHWVLHRCIDAIKRLVNCTNSEEGKIFEIEVYSLSYLFDIKSLQSLTSPFVMANLAKALRDFEFQNAIGGKKLIQILKEEELHVLNEEDLFLGIMDWVKADLPARKQFTAGILQLVYLHCVPTRILKENLSVDAFMKDETCQDLYIDALHCHALKSVRETRPLKPRYNKVLVTFKGTRPLYYETKDNKWHDVPGMDRTPSGQNVKCVGTANYIFLLVDSCKLWRYTCVSNSWAEIFLPEKYSTIDDVLFHNGMLYAMHNKEMWKTEVNEIDLELWATCPVALWETCPVALWETCDVCTHNCTTSYAFEKSIIRFGRSCSTMTYCCSWYDIELEEYFKIQYKLEKAVIAQKKNDLLVIISNGCVYNFYKWSKHCIDKDIPMDLDSGKQFEIPQSQIPTQFKDEAVAVNGRIFLIVGHILYEIKTDELPSFSGITRVQGSNATIVPARKNTVFVCLGRECFHSKSNGANFYYNEMGSHLPQK